MVGMGRNTYKLLMMTDGTMVLLGSIESMKIGSTCDESKTFDTLTNDIKCEVVTKSGRAHTFSLRDNSNGTACLDATSANIIESWLSENEKACKIIILDVTTEITQQCCMALSSFSNYHLTRCS